MNIYVLTVSSFEEEDSYTMLFTTVEKAVNFIKNNYQKDEPKELFTSQYFEGKEFSYSIESQTVDQERL